MIYEKSLKIFVGDKNEQFPEIYSNFMVYNWSPKRSVLATLTRISFARFNLILAIDDLASG